MNEEQHIPIFASCNENYFIYLATMIVSVISNTESFINFYILDGGITQESKDNLFLLTKKFKNFDIEFIKIESKSFDNFPVPNYLSKETYFRYLIPILKPNIDKALYLDVDMVIQGDVLELYNQNLDCYHLAAIPEQTYNSTEYKNSEYYKKQQAHRTILKFDKNHKYFNAGVLIIDCNYFRENDIVKELFILTNKLKKLIIYPDQDIYNKIFENNYKTLDKKYNILVYNELLFNNDKTTFIKYLHETQNYILHFIGNPEYKPYLDQSCFCGEYFWENAKKLPFYEEIVLYSNKYNRPRRIENILNRIN